MYCNYYGFREKPFQITPNPRFLYLSENHKEAFAHLIYGINSHAGFIELTGEVGTGKTTVLRTMLEQLNDSTHRTALILNPCLSAIELLRSINREFGIPHEGVGNGALLDELNRFLLTENREGRTVVLVIDEAQNLAPQVLEQIRLISNLETETDKLIQIILAGQPELKSLLEKPELRQLTQRITVRYHLRPMDFSDSSSYIQHRLQVAGARGKVDFAPEAMKRIYNFSKGSPRLINLACDRALLVGYAEGTRLISGKIAAMALAELKRTAGFLPAGRKKILPAAILCSLAVIGFITIPRPAPDSAVRENKPVVVAAADKIPKKTATQRPPWKALPERPYPAVNAILPLWGQQGIPEKKKGTSVASAVKQRGLSATTVTTLRDLVSLDTPAIVEIMPDKNGKSRFIALTAFDGRTFRIAPELPGSPSISLGELAAVWTGRGHLIWRNSRKIPTNLQRDAEGAGVLQLQRFLTEAGLFKGKQTGILNAATMGAVKKLQSSAGLYADGIPNGRTLLVLYRDHDKQKPPRLSTAKEQQS